MNKKILVAIELDDVCADEVLGQAMQTLQAGDELDVVHVVEPSSLPFVADPSGLVKTDEEIYAAALDNIRGRLQAKCNEYGIDETHCFLKFGRIASEINKCLAAKPYDQLMIGSHGWTGWRRILGSHATSILNAVSIDTWVFKVSGRA